MRSRERWSTDRSASIREQYETWSLFEHVLLQRLADAMTSVCIVSIPPDLRTERVSLRKNLTIVRSKNT